MGERLPLAAIAADFSVLAQHINGHPLAYLDNAATTQMPLAVLDAMRAFETRDRANIHRGVHTLSQRATDDFEAARARIARYVGAGAQHEVVFTSGTTESLNLVAQGLSLAGHEDAVLQPGDEIIVSALEHHANLVPWQLAARRSGAKLRFLLPDAQGAFTPGQFLRVRVNLPEERNVIALPQTVVARRMPCRMVMLSVTAAGRSTGPPRR